MINSEEGYIYDTVCHEYNFAAPITGVHIQDVKSMNNYIKYHIKIRNGVSTFIRKELFQGNMFYFQ